MDPIIDLSDDARDRIKAKEARADHEQEKVRRAVEGKVTSANQKWGGHDNFHEDKLREAHREAMIPFDEVHQLTAQAKFAAHAREYRDVLRDPNKLRPVLASLRELVVKQFGENTRAAIQSLETQAVADAWDDRCPGKATLGAAGGGLTADSETPAPLKDTDSLSADKTAAADTAGNTIAQEQVATSPAPPPYPRRSDWFQKQLDFREWTVHKFQAQGGPDWKTSRKILNGLPVSCVVLEKCAAALSKKKGNVCLRDIPRD